MELRIEQNGVQRSVTPTELFQLASVGAIFPKTRLWVDGKETTCDNVQGIKFAAVPSGPNGAPVPTPVPNPVPTPGPAPVPGGSAERPPRSTSDPRVVRTPFVDYYIGGGGLPYVVCYLDGGRSINSSAGGRVWMIGAIETQNNAQGGLLKSLGRLASGETFFMSSYTAKGPSEIAFATKLPGAIVARQLNRGESIICQRGAYLASTPGVSMEVYFQKRLSTGFFGGEGFVMQKITGPGVVFLEIDGSPVEYDLARGERITCDTGAVAWFDATCSFEVAPVKGFKNMLFGGEGAFETVITGPGKATLQSKSAMQMAGFLAPLVSALVRG